MRKFVLVVEEDVVSVLSIASRSKFQDIINACLNNPVFVELPIDSEVDMLSSYNRRGDRCIS